VEYRKEQTRKLKLENDIKRALYILKEEHDNTVNTIVGIFAKAVAMTGPRDWALKFLGIESAKQAEDRLKEYGREILIRIRSNGEY